MSKHDQELSAEALAIAPKIEKMLRLAQSSNPHEAEVAMRRANELMEAYNLTQASVMENTGDNRRVDEKLKGGHFQFQRDLWRDVAKLNFCLYFSLVVEEKTPAGFERKDPRRPEAGFKRKYKIRRVRQHRIVGRVVNATTTRVMAQYLEQTVERMLAEWLIERYGAEEGPKLTYSQAANSWREGIIEGICGKLLERRRHLMREETRKAEEAKQKAAQTSMAGVSTSTALTISSMTESEWLENQEFLNPGYKAEKAAWDAQVAAERAARAEANRKADEAYTAWALANPIEAKLREDRARRERIAEEKREARNARRRTGRESYGPAYKGDWAARKAGYQASARVSIDQQADRAKSSGEIG